MESIMEEAGSCGRFQIVQVFCICLARFIFVWGAFMMVYGNYNPGWRCKDTITQSRLLSTINYTSQLGHGSNNSKTESFLDAVSTSKTLAEIIASNNASSVDFSKNASLSPPVNMTSTNGSDLLSREYNSKCDVIKMCVGGIEFNPESSTIITEFGLVCDRQWIATVILVLVNAGFVTGSMILGQICEKYGRKIGLYGSTAVVMISSGAAIFSPNWQTYACCSFFMTTGAFGITLSSYVFAIEFLNSKWRGYTASRPIVSLSLCVLSILMKVLKDWRHLHMVACTLSFLACCGYFIVDESPRWLFVHSQQGKGEKVIEKIAKRNGRPPVDSDTLETFIDSLEKDSKEQKQSFSYLDLFRSRKYAIMTLKFSILITFNVTIYRAISFGLKSIPGNFYDNAIISSFLQAGVLLSGGPSSNFTGRRRAGVLFELLGSASCFVIVISLFVAEGITRETIIKISAYIAKAVTQTALAAILLLAVESYPTAIRSVAMGFNNTMSSLGSFVFAFVIPTDNDDISFAICYAAMAVGFFINIFLFYSLPETNKLSLKDNVVAIRKPSKQQDVSMDDDEEV